VLEGLKLDDKCDVNVSKPVTVFIADGVVEAVALALDVALGVDVVDKVDLELNVDDAEVVEDSESVIVSIAVGVVETVALALKIVL